MCGEYDCPHVVLPILIQIVAVFLLIVIVFVSVKNRLLNLGCWAVDKRTLFWFSEKYTPLVLLTSVFVCSRGFVFDGPPHRDVYQGGDLQDSVWALARAAGWASELQELVRIVFLLVPLFILMRSQKKPRLTNGNPQSRRNRKRRL